MSQVAVLVIVVIFGALPAFGVLPFVEVPRFTPCERSVYEKMTDRANGTEISETIIDSMTTLVCKDLEKDVTRTVLYSNTESGLLSFDARSDVGVDLSSAKLMLEFDHAVQSRHWIALTNQFHQTLFNFTVYGGRNGRFELSITDTVQRFLRETFNESLNFVIESSVNFGTVEGILEMTFSGPPSLLTKATLHRVIPQRSNNNNNTSQYRVNNLNYTHPHPHVNVNVSEIPTGLDLLRLFKSSKDAGTFNSDSRRSAPVQRPQRSIKHPISRHHVCKKHALRIDFQGIGYNWIISPVGFYTSICMGICAHPLDGYLHGTVHATLQAYLSQLGVHIDGEEVPNPCCIPDNMSPITVIILEKPNVFTTLNIPDMVVRSCGCH